MPPVPAAPLPPDTPADVARDAPRVPVFDPRVGIELPAPAPEGVPTNRLVSLGDSLTHGFQSGAIFRTELSYPAIIAHELGVGETFRYPRYPGFGGLPLNIEFLLRELERKYGGTLSWWELAPAAFSAFQLLDEAEEWWEHGKGSRLPNITGIHHNLGIYGWDLRDVLSRDADTLAEQIRTPARPDAAPLIDSAGARAALRVLHTARDESGTALTPLGAARQLGLDGVVGDDGRPTGEGDGIETLTVLLGANNALKTVIELRVAWSEDGRYARLDEKDEFTVWRPDHFRAELAELVAQLEQVRARHVILGTVPHVTIAPIARGVDRKVGAGSRYFPHYTRPWIRDQDFQPARDPHLTAEQARAIDSAIDHYNDAITQAVVDARRAGRDWYLLDIAGQLDRLAARRFALDPAARPDWWTPYPLPDALAALDPAPDSRFFVSGAGGRTQCGLFSLDGVHPTTILYGLMAREIMNVMQLAGVRFAHPTGAPRPGHVDVDFERLRRLDTLISDPPRSLSTDLRLLGWLDEHLGPTAKMLRRG